MSRNWLLDEGTKVVAEFNDGYSHIIVDDSCYVLLNGGRPSNWIFGEAIQVIKSLPDNPNDAEKFEPSRRIWERDEAVNQ